MQVLWAKSLHRPAFSLFLYSVRCVGRRFSCAQGAIRDLWELLFRPGYSARDYVAGKRVGRSNILALMIIILALVHNMEAWLAEHGMPPPNTHAEVFVWIMNSYYKAIYLSMIPILSVLTWLVFKKLEYNFTEHLVLNCYALSGGFLLESLLTIIEYLISYDSTGNVSFLFFFVYPAYTYYQVMRGYYTVPGLIYRVLLVVLSFTLALLSLIRFICAPGDLLELEKMMPISREVKDFFDI